MKYIFVVSAFTLWSVLSFAQTAENYAVEITASTQTLPPAVTLVWKAVPGDSSYLVFKKAKADLFWTGPIATLTPADTFFTDTSVIIDSAYEYNVVASCTSWMASGYIYAGIRNPPAFNMGAIILLVDSLFADSCAPAITTLMNDLSGDGWQIVRHDLLRSMPDTTVKTIIRNDYFTYSSVNAVLLIGHIAVPYSADFDTIIYPPDGHVPLHQGAWPADIYYASFGGPWTDSVADDTLGSWTVNWNVPGDGKWDQDSVIATTALQISRIDFYNMPAFGATEVQMMNNYLARDHQYKMDSLNICRRALISDNFGAFYGEAFAANGWRNFAPIVTPDSVHVGPLVSSLADSSYLWAYGCGGGSFTSASGVGSTTDFAANPVNGIFMMLFGSFFGDWNTQNDFLRAPLCAATPALTNCWAGRPNWFFHHMALGANIGYSAWLTQNNNGILYMPGGYGTQYIHAALMGDLSLRTDYIKPPSGLTILAPHDSGAFLSWTPSPDTGVLGYYVYRADSLYGYYQLLSGLISGTTYHDTTGVNSLKFYMVRPEKLQNTPSGGYYNLGVGIADTATVTYPPLFVQQEKSSVIKLVVYPNPATTQVNADFEADLPGEARVSLINNFGQVVFGGTRKLKLGENKWSINVSNLPTGSYQFVVLFAGHVFSQQWVKI